MARWMMVLVAGLSLSVAACDSKDTGDSEEADTDTDADADTDSDTDTDCALNSAWPCSCDVPGSTCNDGSDCILIKGIGTKAMGYCAASCMGKGASCPDTDFTGDGQCLVSDGTNSWCVLMCTTADDCPSDQDCDTSLGTGLCYPV